MPSRFWCRRCRPHCDTLQRYSLPAGKRFRHAGCQRKRVQRRRFWQRHQRLLHPASLRYRTNGIAYDFTVTHNFAFSRDIHRGDFMSLRNMLSQFQPVREAGSCFKPLSLTIIATLSASCTLYKTPSAVPVEFQCRPLVSILQQNSDNRFSHFLMVEINTRLSEIKHVSRFNIKM